MKKIALLGLGTLLIPALTFGQDEEKIVKKDTSKINISNVLNLQIIKTETEDDTTHTIEFESKEKSAEDSLKSPVGTGMGYLITGMNGYLNSSNNLDFSGAYEDYQLKNGLSYSLLNFLNEDIQIVKDKLAWHFSMGVEWNSYSFSGNKVLTPDTNTVVFTDPGIKFRTNNFGVTALLGSTMIEANIKKNFHLGFGASLGYIGNGRHTYTTKHTINEVKFTNKAKDDFNINPWKTSLIAKIGYKKFNIFASYSPQFFGKSSELFKRNSGAEILHPFSIGIALINLSE